MDIVGALVLVGFLLFFAGMIFFMVRSSRGEVEKKQQVARSLGFSPVEADPKLTDQIAGLYRHTGAKTKYELRNVSRRLLPDGEMVLFDLVNTSGEDDSWSEHQAVAVISPYLKLPSFSLFPKVDPKYALSGLANKVMEWGVSFLGAPLEFPEYPEFNARCILTSDESSDWVRAAISQDLAGYLSRTQMCKIHAAGDIFAFSEMGGPVDVNDQSVVSQRVNRALDVFRLLQT